MLSSRLTVVWPDEERVDRLRDDWQRERERVATGFAAPQALERIAAYDDSSIANLRSVLGEHQRIPANAAPIRQLALFEPSTAQSKALPGRGFRRLRGGRFPVRGTRSLSPAPTVSCAFRRLPSVVAAMATVSGPASGLADISRVAGESVESWLRSYDGYRGLIVLADEEGQRSQVITLWETHEAEAEARVARGAMRDQIAAMAGMTVVDFGVYEAAVFKIPAQP